MRIIQAQIRARLQRLENRWGYLLDAVDTQLLWGAFPGNFDNNADFLIEERLRQRGRITDDAAGRVAVPCS
jgi:hypothetical protein